MDLVCIIERLMVPDTAIIQNATKELEHALTLPQTIPVIYNIMTEHINLSIRQLSAMILKKHFHNSWNYQQLSLGTRETIKNHILSAIFNEKENLVRSGIIQLLSEILRHESQNNNTAPWISEVLMYILNQCGSDNAYAMEIGSFVFSKLADSLPKLFVNQFSLVKEIFEAAILSVEKSSTNISPTVILNVLTAMGDLVPALAGSCTEADQIYEAAVPHIVKITIKFADENLTEHFNTGLEILQNMAEYTPMLLNQYVRILMEFACAISSNISYSSAIRTQALHFITTMIAEKKKMLLKLNLVEPTLNIIFNIMASEPESDDPDEFFVESEIVSPLASATVVIDKMASTMPPEKFIPPILILIEPALNNKTDHLRRRAAYIILATISEECKEAITDEYLEPMLNVIKQGLNDPVVSVRNAALFAVGQFSEHLQPEIAGYANVVLPFLFLHMQEIFQAYQLNQKINMKCADRVLYALESFCDSMEDDLAPYMDKLMYIILTLLSNHFPQNMKIFAMGLIESTARAFTKSLLPWFQQIMEKLRPLLLMQEGNVDANALRAQAIFALAAIAKNVDKHFVIFAPEVLQESFVWIEKTDDIDIRNSVINLFGALASILGEDLAPALPKILDYISRCMLLVSNPIPTLSVDDLETQSNSVDTQIGNNPYLDAKMQCITTIQELAESCMKILIPFAKGIYETVYKMIDSDSDDLRKSSIAAAKVLIIKWNQESSSDVNAKQTLPILLTKLLQVVSMDHQSDNVIEALVAINDILEDLENIALPTKEDREAIVRCIGQGLSYKYKCLSIEDTSSEMNQYEDDCESVQSVIVGSANLLVALAKAVGSEEFAEYFKCLEPYIINNIVSSTNADFQDNIKERGKHFIGILAECYAPLGLNVAPYFDKHYRIMMCGSKKRNAKIRQNSIVGLGELVRAGNGLSYNYFPEILNNLSLIIENEKKHAVLESIAGTLARLILTNASLVPLEKVIPTMLKMLPSDYEAENCIVIECFDFLYNINPGIMKTHTADVITVVIQSIAQTCTDKRLLNCGKKLMQRIESIYPVDYQQTMSCPTLLSLLSNVKDQART